VNDLSPKDEAWNKTSVPSGAKTWRDYLELWLAAGPASPDSRLLTGSCIVRNETDRESN
jgi:hypothetical protein